MASDVELAVEIHVLNDRPDLKIEPTSIEKIPDEEAVYTVEATDPDGVERVQIRLGVYAPIGGAEWTMMHDDGVNGGDELQGMACTASCCLFVRAHRWARTKFR